MKKLLKAAAAAAALLLAPSAASAADFSFAGNISTPNDVLLFNFTANGSSSVTLVSYSYAGGTQANGNIVTRGGFDPLLALYDSTGAFIADDDDGSPVVDPFTGNSYDVLFSRTLAAGNYTVALTDYPRRANGSALNPADPSTAFSGTGTLNGRTSAFAFDVLGVDTSTGPGAGAVPEPATWAMMIGGFGAVGGAMRRRRTTTSVRFA